MTGKVAIKTVSRFLDGIGLDSDMENEIAWLKTVRHPNIVLFFGAGVFDNGRAVCLCLCSRLCLCVYVSLSSSLSLSLV